MATRFEIVETKPRAAPPEPPAPPPAPAPAAPPPAPAAATRPVALSILGVLLTAAGTLAALFVAGLAVFALLLGSETSWLGEVFFVVFAALVAVGVPIAALILSAGVGILRRRRWSRGVGFAACGLLGLSAMAPFSLAATGETAAAVETLAFSPQALLGVFGLVVLFLPSTRDYYDALPRGAPGEVASRGVVRSAYAAGGAVGVLALATITLLPLSSLRSGADGDALREHATIGLAAGVLVALAAAAALTRAARYARVPSGAVVGGAFAGLLLGALLVGAARELSTSVVLDGVAQGTGLLSVAMALMGLWAVLLVVLVVHAAPPEAGLLRWGGVTLAAFATALFALSSYVLANVEPLQEAAAARTRRSTPGLELALLLVTLLALALWRRGARERRG